MPPKNATAAAARRKGPSFNPPRPVGESSKATTTKRAPATTAAAKKTNAPTAKSGFQAAKDIIDLDLDLSSSSAAPSIPDDDLDISDISMDDLIEDAPAPVALSEPVVPRPLLARLLLENFDDPNIQIQTGAMKLVGKYIDIFVTEAFLRSKDERRSIARGSGGIEGIGDGFLQVEDLERLAPQLVLDF